MNDQHQTPGKEPPFQAALVIEPEMLARLALRQQLLQTGIPVVHEAEDGDDGMAWLSGRGVEVVFSGWEPGGVTCLEMLKTLRGPGKTPSIPVVLLDWGLSQVTIVAAVKAGISGRILMPSTPAKVQQALLEVQDAQATAREISANH